jgi:hypothetical protein
MCNCSVSGAPTMCRQDVTRTGHLVRRSEERSRLGRRGAQGRNLRAHDEQKSLRASWIRIFRRANFLLASLWRRNFLYHVGADALFRPAEQTSAVRRLDSPGATPGNRSAIARPGRRGHLHPSRPNGRVGEPRRLHLRDNRRGRLPCSGRVIYTHSLPLGH